MHDSIVVIPVTRCVVGFLDFSFKPTIPDGTTLTARELLPLLTLTVSRAVLVDARYLPMVDSAQADY